MKKVHRFIIQNLSLPESGEMTVVGDVFSQMKNVLKLEPGEEVGICDGAGSEAICRIVSYEKGGARLEIIALEKESTPSRKLSLFCAILKNENLEWVVQKASEIGACRIIPIITDRTIKTGIRKDRLQSIAKEAVELAGRSNLVEILDPVNFKEALDMISGGWFMEASGVASKDAASCDSVFVGPEGGWSEKEINQAKLAKLTFVSLGENVLRAETAATLAVFEALQKN